MNCKEVFVVPWIFFGMAMFVLIAVVLAVFLPSNGHSGPTHDGE